MHVPNPSNVEGSSNWFIWGLGEKRKPEDFISKPKMEMKEIPRQGTWQKKGWCKRLWLDLMETSIISPGDRKPLHFLEFNSLKT